MCVQLHIYIPKTSNIFQKVNIWNNIEIKNNKISMGSLLGVHNSTVSNELGKMVKDWFRASKKSHSIKKRGNKVRN